MHHIEIYNFSGTGNSLAVAKDLAAGLGAKLTPAASVVNQERVHTEAEVIGFVFPIYDFKPPALIEALIRKMDHLEAKYLFGVCTYGITVGKSLQRLDKVIASCGGQLAGGFAVAMPHNGIGSGVLPKTRHETMFREGKKRAVEISAYIKARQTGRIESSSLFSILLQPRFLRATPTLLRFMTRVVFKGVSSLALTASPHCDGCGVCARVCPVRNIALVGARPSWSDHCAGCMACLHWCPKGAISLGGADLDIAIYHHPEVRLSDMLRKK